MEAQNFDLSVPVTRLFRALWITYGVILIILGVLNMTENSLLGALQLVLGLATLPFMGLLHHFNKYIIALNDANLKIRIGLIRNKKIQWESIREIHIQLMKVEFRLDTGKNAEINFSNISYSDNQIIKPQIFDAVTAFAEAKGIPVQDGRSG